MEVRISRQNEEHKFQSCPLSDVEQLLSHFADQYGYDLTFNLETKYNTAFLVIEHFFGEEVDRILIEGSKSAVVTLFKQLVCKINDSI